MLHELTEALAHVSTAPHFEPEYKETQHPTLNPNIKKQKFGFELETNVWSRSNKRVKGDSNEK